MVNKGPCAMAAAREDTLLLPPLQGLLPGHTLAEIDEKLQARSWSGSVKHASSNESKSMKESVGRGLWAVGCGRRREHGRDDIVGIFCTLLQQHRLANEGDGPLAKAIMPPLSLFMLRRLVIHVQKICQVQENLSCPGDLSCPGGKRRSSLHCGTRQHVADQKTDDPVAYPSVDPRRLNKKQLRCVYCTVRLPWVRH